MIPIGTMTPTTGRWMKATGLGIRSPAARPRPRARGARASALAPSRVAAPAPPAASAAAETPVEASDPPGAQARAPGIPAGTGLRAERASEAKLEGPGDSTSPGLFRYRLLHSTRTPHAARVLLNSAGISAALR